MKPVLGKVFIVAGDNIHSIFMSIRGSLARSVLGIVPPKEIEDIVQETYVRVCQIEHRGGIREPRSFLFKTARNLALDYLKKADTRLTVSQEDDTQRESLHNIDDLTDKTFDEVASKEEFSQFCEAVRHLPVQCRRAFVLKKVYGYSQREIAQKMNLSEGTVEKHISLGIKRCTYFMMQHGERYKRKQAGSKARQRNLTDKSACGE